MEKIAIRVHGYLQKDENIYVPDELIQDPLKAEEELNIRLDPTEEKRSCEASLSIEYGKIIFKLRQEECAGVQKWKLCYVTINLARFLFGHNARLILTDEELQAALTIANDTINKCVMPDGKDMVIPGIVAHSQSYYNYLEIAYQVHDPEAQIISKLKNARLLHYSSDNLMFEDMKTSGKSESVYLGNQSNPIVVCYRKDIEIRQRKRGSQEGAGRWFTDVDNCVRMEVRLHKRKLINVMLGESSAYEDGHRVKTFSMDDIFNAYETLLRDIRGVFTLSDTPYASPKKFKERTAELISQWEKFPSPPPLNQFLKDVQKDEGLSDPTMNILRVNMERYLCCHSSLNLAALLPSSGKCAAMHIEPLRKDNLGQTVPIFGKLKYPLELDPMISEAYSAFSTLNIKGCICDAKMPWMPGY